jgi:YVTN family beta-propeller protein
MRFTSLLALVLVTAGIARGGETPNPALLVLEKQDGMLAIVDPSTLQVVARVPVGTDPHEVAVSDDGTTAYASNYGFFGAGGPGHTIAVVDLTSQKELPVIELGALVAPHGLDFAGGELFFTAEGAKAIGRYSPATQKVDWILGTGQERTHMVKSHNEKLILASNVASGTISIFSLPEDSFSSTHSSGSVGAANQVVMPPLLGTLVPVGSGCEGFDVSADWKYLWVANADDGTVSIVDIARKKVIDTVPDAVAHANRLKFTLDGRYALISDLQSDALTVMDVMTRMVIKKIPLGSSSEGILIAPDGRRAFIALGPGNAVDVIDLATWTVSGKIQTGRGPDGMAWAVRR